MDECLDLTDDGTFLRFPVFELSHMQFEIFPHEFTSKSFFLEFHLDLTLPFAEREKCPHPHLQHEILIIANLQEKSIYIRTFFLREVFRYLRSRWSISAHVVRDAECEIHEERV